MAGIHSANIFNPPSAILSLIKLAFLEVYPSIRCVSASIAVFTVTLSERLSVYFASRKETSANAFWTAPFFVPWLWSVNTAYWVVSLPVPAVVAISAIGICLYVPVSYTHLDVYKRQAYKSDYKACTGKYCGLNDKRATFFIFSCHKTPSYSEGIFPSYPCILIFLLSPGSRTFFLILMLVGVTSTYSSSEINSRDCSKPVSYTHLDVYKRQVQGNMVTAEGVQLNHYPDFSKPRSQYLPLLELSVKEDPDDDRNMHYLGRESVSYTHLLGYCSTWLFKPYKICP